MAQHIIHGVGIGLFISAGSVSIGLIAATMAPQWDRICRLALGNVEPSTTPLRQGASR